MILVRRLDLVRKSGRVSSREHGTCVLVYPYNTETREHQVKMNENKFKTNLENRISFSLRSQQPSYGAGVSYKIVFINT